MCDYSLHSVRSRPAKVGDRLTTRDFGIGTRGFAASDDPYQAVCLRPGTELSFARGATCLRTGLFPWHKRAIKHNTAIFRQINHGKVAVHHDALEFPDGQIVLVTLLTAASYGSAVACGAKNGCCRWRPAIQGGNLAARLAVRAAS
jgi:hypothetical protein